jgi:hypothetical protein
LWGFLFQEDFFLPIYGIYFILLHLYAVVLKTGVACLSAWIDPIIFFFPQGLDYLGRG